MMDGFVVPQFFEKKQAARNKKLEGEMAQVMTNLYLWQKYNFPQCCKSGGI
jgi:hypothetical protein